MANAKNVHIKGVLPYDCNRHYGMSRVLAHLNAPASGLQMVWGSAFTVPTANDGQKTMFLFDIMGVDAVNNEYLRVVLQAVVDCGGTVQDVQVFDVDNNNQPQRITMPQPRVPGVYHYTVEVRLDGERDPCVDNVNIYEYMADVLKYGVAAPELEGRKPFNAVVSRTNYSVHPA